MQSDTPAATIADLDALLQEERAALLRGDLDGVAQLHDTKERLIDDLSRLDAELARDELAELNQKVERNQALLNGALAGIRSVSRRLAAVRRVRQSLEFYGEDGSKSQVDVAVQRSVEKRA